MADDALPIVFAGRRRDKLSVLAFGLVMLVGGIFMISDQDGGSLRGGARPSDVGWLVAGVGLVFTVLVLPSLAGICPRLELNREGIFYRTCLRGVTKVAWSEFDRAEILPVRRSVPVGRDINLDCVMVFTTDGRKVVISAPISPADIYDLQETITRVAARIRSAHGME